MITLKYRILILFSAVIISVSNVVRAEEKNEVKSEILNLRLLVKNINKNSSIFRNVSFDTSILTSLRLTQHQITNGWIEVNGSSESFVTAEGKRVAMETKTKAEHKAILNIVNFDHLQLENLTVDDIKDDPALKLVKISDYELPTKIDCSSFIRINLNQRSRSVGGDINVKKLLEFRMNLRDISGGIFLTTFNIQSCSMTYQAYFPTSKYGAFHILDWVLDSIYPGSLVILNSLDDGSLLLNETSRSLLKNYGSKWSEFYSYKDLWTHIFIKGGPTLYETILPNMKIENDNFLSLYMHLPVLDSCMNWPDSPEWSARRILCSESNAFGRLCDCRRPLQFTNHIQLDELFDIPIAIITSHGRSKFLVRLLETLLESKEIHNYLIVISMDQRDEQILTIAFILGIRVIMRRGNEKSNAKIAQNVRFSLYHQLKLFPKSKNFILLEDDLMVSKDFYRFMKNVSPIFDLDRSIWCVSGFNFLSYNHTSIDPSRLYRGSLLPVLGWMMPRYVLEEIIPKWAPPELNIDWDFYLVNGYMNKGRTCIVPEVLRSMHGPSLGVHIKFTLMNEKNYNQRILNSQRNVKLQSLNSLVKKNYDRDVLQRIKSADRVTIKSSDDFRFPFSENKNYVLYLNKSSETHQMSSILVHKILYIYDEIQIYIMDLEQFNYYNVTLFIIGYPSPYSIYIPEDYSFYIPSTNEIESYFEYREKITEKENAKKFSHRIEGNSVLDLEESLR